MPAPRTCIICESSYKPKTGTQVCCSDSCARARAAAQWRERQTFRHQRNCLRCGTQMAPRTRKDGNRLYCSDACKFTPLEPVPDVAGGIPCAHCARMFTPPSAKTKYCGASCRVAAFKAKQVEGDTEIPVADLEAAPRGLRLAKMFDRYEGFGLFEQWTPPQWINPADKRASR